MLSTKALIEDARRHGRAVIVLLAVTVGLDVIALLYRFSNEAGEGGSSAELTIFFVFSILKLGLRLATPIVFLVWLYKSVLVVPRIRNRYFPHTPGAAVLSFFIPIVNLYRPYLILKDSFVASAPMKGGVSPTVHAQLGLWWVCWWGSVVVGVLSMLFDPVVGAFGGLALTGVSAFLLAKLILALHEIQSWRLAEIDEETMDTSGAYPRPAVPTY